jgi:hypothetical protein
MFTKAKLLTLSLILLSGLSLCPIEAQENKAVSNQDIHDDAFVMDFATSTGLISSPHLPNLKAFAMSDFKGRVVILTNNGVPLEEATFTAHICEFAGNNAAILPLKANLMGAFASKGPKELVATVKAALDITDISKVDSVSFGGKNLKSGFLSNSSYGVQYDLEKGFDRNLPAPENIQGYIAMSIIGYDSKGPYTLSNVQSGAVFSAMAAKLMMPKKTQDFLKNGPYATSEQMKAAITVYAQPVLGIKNLSSGDVNLEYQNLPVSKESGFSDSNP